LSFEELVARTPKAKAPRVNASGDAEADRRSTFVAQKSVAALEDDEFGNMSDEDFGSRPESFLMRKIGEERQEQQALNDVLAHAIGVEEQETGVLSSNALIEARRLRILKDAMEQVGISIDREIMDSQLWTTAISLWHLQQKST